jgi:hypothetical protein
VDRRADSLPEDFDALRALALNAIAERDATRRLPSVIG